MTCSALEETGIDDIWATILDHRKKMTDTGELEVKRKKQALDWMWTLVEDGLRRRFDQNSEIESILPAISKDVEKGFMAPTVAASRLLSLLDRPDSS